MSASSQVASEASFAASVGRSAAARPHHDKVRAMSAAAEVIGIDHIYLTVSSVERSQRFYDRVLMDALGFRKNGFTLDGDGHVQYYNRHFGVVLRPARGAAPRHDRYAPGLHHLCLRVDAAGDVDRV